MKKTVSAIAAFALIAVNSAYAIDLNDLGGETSASTGTVTSTGTASNTASTGATATTATASADKTVSKIQIIPEVPTLVADGKKVVPVAVRVTNEADEPLSTTDVELVAEIVGNDSAKSLGSFNTGAYSEEQKYFEFNYVA